METTYIKTTSGGLALLAAGLVLASLVGGLFYMRAKAFENTLSVTGSAKMEVVADTAKWSFDIVRKVKFEGQKQGYENIAEDVSTTKTFLASSGISADAVTVAPVQLSVDYDKQQLAGTEPDYQLRARVTINATDVNLLSRVAEKVPELVNSGVFISNTSLEYFYSKLSDVRVTLSGEAIKDAKQRAESIAKASNGRVGSLQSVSGGVIQVLAPNSTDVSDYGTYDTSTINKVITLSVRAAFTIK